MLALFCGLGSIGQRHLRNLQKICGNDIEIIAHRVLNQPGSKPSHRMGLKVFDLPGVALRMFAVVSFVVGIQMAKGVNSILAWPLIGMALAVAVLFIRYEWNQSHPTLPVRLFKNSSFAIPSIYNLTFNQ